MMRLIATELTRLRWRRAVAVLVASAFVVPLLIGVVTVWDSRPFSADEIATARARAVEQPSFQSEVRHCEKRPRSAGVQTADQCEEQVISWFADLHREPLNLRNELTNSSIGVASLVLILVVLMGSTYAGADWASGSMSNQLLFEPRRLRVWTAKALAVGLLAALLTSVVLTLYWLGLGGAAALRDLPLASGVLGEIAWMILRCTFLAIVGAVGGYALTMLSRSTVFTLGAMFAVAVGQTVFVAALPLGPGKERWLAPTNLLAVMQGRATYWTQAPAECAANEGDRFDAAMLQLCNGRALLGVWEALPFVLVPVVIVVALSVWSFGRRDVA